MRRVCGGPIVVQSTHSRPSRADSSDAALAEQHGGDLFAVHDHADHDVARAATAAGVVVRARAVLAGPSGGLAGRVRPHVQLVARARHVGGHARAHDAEAEEADPLAVALIAESSPTGGFDAQPLSRVQLAGAPAGQRAAVEQVAPARAGRRRRRRRAAAWRRRSAISENVMLARAPRARARRRRRRGGAPLRPSRGAARTRTTRSGNSRSSASIGRVERVAHRHVHAARPVGVRRTRPGRRRASRSRRSARLPSVRLFIVPCP